MELTELIFKELMVDNSLVLMELDARELTPVLAEDRRGNSYLRLREVVISGVEKNTNGIRIFELIS